MHSNLENLHTNISGLHYISPMQQAKLCIDLYNDYLNESLGNSVSQADEFSSIITENVFVNSYWIRIFRRCIL